VIRFVNSVYFDALPVFTRVERWGDIVVTIRFGRIVQAIHTEGQFGRWCAA
jgi:hypothetical protein